MAQEVYVTRSQRYLSDIISWHSIISFALFQPWQHFCCFLSMSYTQGICISCCLYLECSSPLDICMVNCLNPSGLCSYTTSSKRHYLPKLTPTVSLSLRLLLSSSWYLLSLSYHTLPVFYLPLMCSEYKFHENRKFVCLWFSLLYL